jgi:hypothetical protein
MNGETNPGPQQRKHMDPTRSHVGAERAFVLSAVFVVLLTQHALTYGQESTESIPRASSNAPPTTEQTNDNTAAQAAATTPGQAPVPDFLHQEELTGHWNGVRTKLKNKGFELASSLTQFYQGVASGGTDTGSEYNGTERRPSCRSILTSLQVGNTGPRRSKPRSASVAPCSPAPERSVP